MDFLKDFLNRYQNETKVMIEKAKKTAKDRFKFFATDALDIPSDIFEHLWRVPIVEYQEIINILVDAVSEDKKEATRNYLEKRLKDDIGEQDAVFINIDEIIDDLKANVKSEEYSNLLTEVQKLLERKEYNAMIIYDYKKLEMERRNFEAQNDEQKVNEQVLESAILKKFTHIFLHEICHLNANVLLSLEKGDSITANGVSEIPGRVVNPKLIKKMGNFNEVMVDTLAQIINNYPKERDIDKALGKIIKDRGGVSQYDDYDDTFVLSLYTIFTEEMIEWMLLGAYNDVSNNILKEKIVEICGGFVPKKDKKNQEEKEDKAEKYVKKEKDKDEDYNEELQAFADENIDVDDNDDFDLMNKINEYFKSGKKLKYSPSKMKLRKEWLNLLQGIEEDEVENKVDNEVEI